MRHQHSPPLLVAKPLSVRMNSLPPTAVFVREATASSRVAVTAHLPVDVLGVYCYLPA